MKKMGHPYVVKLIEIIDDPQNEKIYLIQEFMKGGDLQKRIDLSVKTPLIESTIRKYFRQLLSAVWYCHEVVNILHRDIKPENILIDSDDNIRLADFGVSRFFRGMDSDHVSDNAGSEAYFCPEAWCIHEGETYSGKAADLWACGITLYQMIFKKLPFLHRQRCCLHEIVCT